MTALALLAGAVIGLGGAFYTLVMTGVDAGYRPARLLGGAGGVALTDRAACRRSSHWPRQVSGMWQGLELSLS